MPLTIVLGCGTHLKDIQHPYRVVYGVGLRLCSVGWQADPPASLIGSSQGTTQELNPWGSPVNLGVPFSQIVLADSLLLEDLNVDNEHSSPLCGVDEGQPKTENLCVVDVVVTGSTVGR